jgi:FxsC-like protein
MTIDGGGPGPATYFFLSYAHTAPLDGEERAPVDSWVSKLFDDLSEAVRAVAPGRPSGRVGFFDGVLKAGEDWKARIARELGAAEVFVPLCSPSYFAMSWPGREWSCFASRLVARPADEADRHIVPVLWTPLSRGQRTPGGIDPRRLAPQRPEYVENGLRALKMLTMYRDSYRAVVDGLAREIVRAARESPLRPAAVPPLDTFPSAFQSEDSVADFVVAVAAPTAGTAPRGRDGRAYGAVSTDWRPFGDRERLRLAEHAVTAAERLDFSTVALGAAEAARIGPSTPAVVLIDPWIAEPGSDGAQLAALRRLFVAQRRQWTLPLVVLDSADPQSGEDRERLLEDLRRVLDSAGALTTEAARRGARGVTSIEEFATVMPVMVTEAERQYIKHSSDFRRAGAPGPGGGDRSQHPDDER